MTHYTSNFDLDFSGGLPRFSWSLRRRRLFELCRRAYYFHYYGAAGGWDAHCPDQNRLTYQLKHLYGVEEWVHHIFAEAISQTFLRRRPQFKNNLVFMIAMLRQECSARFRRGWDEVKEERWREDPKTLNLTELYYATNQERREKTFEYGRLRLEQLLQGFARHPIAAAISDIDSLKFRHFERPVAIKVEPYDVWIAPAMIWQDAECLHLFSVTGPDAQLPDELALKTALYHILAETEYRFPAETVTAQFYYPGLVNQPPEMFEPQAFSREVCRQTVADSAAVMLSHVGSDGNALESDFPGWNTATSVSVCGKCRFRQLCG